MFGARHPVTAVRKQCHQCVALWLAAVVGMMLVTPRAAAEEEALLSYSNPFPRADSMTLWDAPRAASSVAVQITVDLRSLVEAWVGELDLLSIFQYEHQGSSSAPTLFAGFGQYFPDHPVAILATDG